MASTEKAFRSLQGKNLDKLRVKSNRLWYELHGPIFECFGKLGTLIWGELQNDTYLEECYVNEFNVNQDRQRLANLFKTTGIPSGDESFIKFSLKHSRQPQFEILNNFDLPGVKRMILKGKGTTILLLGDRGCGKSEFVSFLLNQLRQRSSDVTVFAVNLADATAPEEPIVKIYESLTVQIRQAVFMLGKQRKLSDRNLINLRFERELREYDALISKDDPDYVKREKEKRRSEVIHMMLKKAGRPTRERVDYLKTGTDLLKTFNKKVCLIFDDCDRIQHIETAQRVQQEVSMLAETLDVPVVVSLREVTVKKSGDTYGDFQRYHILPPSFEDIVEKRFAVFERKVRKNTPPAINISGKLYTVDDYIGYVKTMIESITTKEENLFLFYMLSNSNMERMLDYLKCLLASPHLEARQLESISSGDRISQQKIMETLLLYVYKEINRENTFLMNMFDSGHRNFVMRGNNLFRIRALQILRQFGSTNERNRQALNFSELKDKLAHIGYNRLVEEELSLLIKRLVDFSIVETSIPGERYEENDAEIMLLDPAYYYLDYMIYTYRYIQTILPDTWLDYEVDSFLSLRPPREIDEEINKFILFIERSELAEEKYVQDRDILRQLNIGGKISAKMWKGYEADRQQQIRHPRKRGSRRKTKG